MFSLRSNERYPKRRPWLLLWLLPYLVFNVAGEGMHTEVWPGSSNHAPAHRAHLSRTVQSSDDDNCLMCQWAALSTASLATPATAQRKLTLTSVGSTFFSTLVHTCPLRYSKRGPPLV